jgi:hypothetical protein
MSRSTIKDVKVATKLWGRVVYNRCDAAAAGTVSSRRNAALSVDCDIGVGIRARTHCRVVKVYNDGARSG